LVRLYYADPARPDHGDDRSWADDLKNFEPHVAPSVEWKVSVITLDGQARDRAVKDHGACLAYAIAWTQTLGQRVFYQRHTRTIEHCSTCRNTRVSDWESFGPARLLDPKALPAPVGNPGAGDTHG
jgi:hypothetical protein